MNAVSTRSATNYALGLHAGDWVEVKSTEEILATLDDRGSLDALPFMPEMLQYCGKRFQVFKSAHKTCDTINKTGNRGMTNAVHLQGLRCDGAAHGGCQAGCLLFWKEAWLRRVPGSASFENREQSPSGMPHEVKSTGSCCDLETLAHATRASAGNEERGGVAYRCQATELFRATTPLRWWDPRHYLKDLTSRNVRPFDLVRYVLIAAYNAVMRLHWRGHPYPFVRGLAEGKTPAAVLNLQPGELVQVRSKEEIMPTINEHLRNRGLSFDVEMVPYCGRTFRVLSRVERIINEKTGKMMTMPNDCIILDGVVCGGCLSRNRLFCPRSIYPYWREIWLKRVGEMRGRSKAEIKP